MKSKKSKVLKISLIFLFLQIITLVLSSFLTLPDMLEQYVMILLPAIVIALLAKVNIKERFKFNSFKLSSLGYIIFLVALTIPVSTLIAELTVFFLGKNPIGIDSYVENLDLTFLGLIFSLAVSPSICEELIFRGLLLDRTSGLSLHKLAFINGVMFALFHIGYDQLFYTFFMGIVLAYVAIIANSIYPPIIMHFLFNGFSVVEIALEKSTGQVLFGFIDTSSTFGFLALCIVSIISIVLIIKVIKKLIIIYDYDDSKRLQSNSEDVEIYKQSNKFKVYWPQLVVALFVLAMNLAIFYTSDLDLIEHLH